MQAGAETFKNCTIEIPMDEEENGNSNQNKLDDWKLCSFRIDLHENKVLLFVLKFKLFHWICKGDLYAQCLKIAKKVAFNIASEASYIYILSGHKFIKNAKKWSILASF